MTLISYRIFEKDKFSILDFNIPTTIQQNNTNTITTTATTNIATTTIFKYNTTHEKLTYNKTKTTSRHTNNNNNNYYKIASNIPASKEIASSSFGSLQAVQKPKRHPTVSNIIYQDSRTVSSISSEESGLGSTESDALLSGSRATSARKTASINSTAEGGSLANSVDDYDHKRRRRKK